VRCAPCATYKRITHNAGRRTQDAGRKAQSAKRTMFKITVLNPKHELFEGEAKSVILPGDRGEFEILDFHKSVISLLKEGNVIIDGKYLAIKRGVAKFHEGELIALVEE
jgi:F-type H+-transporting ATPase subunit epsilon